MWCNSTLERLTIFYKKHSLLFKNKERSINKDAIIKSVELYSIVQEMYDREKFSFIDKLFLTSILKRIEWVFRQLLIDYRNNYKEYLKFKEDDNRFFKISPTGKVLINQRVYNIPKHFSDKGMYPNLSEGVWVKEYTIKEK